MKLQLLTAIVVAAFGTGEGAHKPTLTAGTLALLDKTPEVETRKFEEAKPKRKSRHKRRLDRAKRRGGWLFPIEQARLARRMAGVPFRSSVLAAERVDPAIPLSAERDDPAAGNCPTRLKLPIRRRLKDEQEDYQTRLQAVMQARADAEAKTGANKAGEF